MQNTFTKVILSVIVFLTAINSAEAQSLSSISPNISQQGQTLTTTITASGNIFVPGSPMGGYDIRMIKSGGVYEIDSDFGTVQYNDPNHVDVHWSFPGAAPTGMYDLYVDATDGFGGWMTHLLSSSFQLGCLISLSETHTNTTCGNNNGTIDLTATSGTPPYTFAWSNGATTEDLSLLAQGIYSVTVTDASPCSHTLNNIIIGNTNGPNVSETHLSSTCANANGSINITVTGGTAPYTFNWSNGATTEDITGLLASTYLVTVTDFNSCAGYISSTVSDSNDLAITSTMHQYGCTNFAGLYASVLSGVGPYSYHWNNNSFADSLVNVYPGSYAVTVTDAGGCTQTQSFSAPVYNYYIYFSSVPPLTGCSTQGSISASITGGTGPYSYIWSNGNTTSSNIGLIAGSYSLTITDALGCTREGSTNLTSATSFAVIEGDVFDDINGNCIFDTGDNTLGNIFVHASNGSLNYYGYTNSSGHYTIRVYSTGTYNLTSSFYSSCGTAVPCGGSIAPISISNLCDTVSNSNFGFTGISGFDLAIHPGWHSANPGFDKYYWIFYYTPSSQSFTDTATITFIYDSLLTYHYSNSNPQPSNDSAAHTLTWQVTNVAGWGPQVTAYFHVPASIPLGYHLYSHFEITPLVGDCNTGNNSETYSEVITGSHDPNSKEVIPEGNITEADSILTYKINFQNTGTAPTNFVIVTDTLPSYLDPATVVNLASSHDYSSFDISGAGILTWTFNPLFLVDSFTNEPESNGFILFSIKRKPNLPFGTLIENTASVYFDYNEPVITNTVQSMVINSVKNISDKTISVIAYPNPFTESTMFVVNGIKGEYNFELTNVLGEKVKEIKHINAKQFTLNRTDLSQGIYFYKIVVEGKTIATGKIVAD